MENPESGEPGWSRGHLAYGAMRRQVCALVNHHPDYQSFDQYTNYWQFPYNGNGKYDEE